MPTLHILGSGSCFPTTLQKGRLPPGYLIEWGQSSRLLFECSEGITRRLEAIGVLPDDIAHLAVSHSHPDHCALPQFIQSTHCSRSTKPGFSRDDPSTFSELHLYTSKHIIKNLPILNKIHFQETVAGKTAGLVFPIIHPHELPAPDSIALPEGATLTAAHVYHGFGKVDALAFRLTLPSGIVIAYSGDTGMCDGIMDIARGADIFISEASALIGDDTAAHVYGHLNPRQAGEIARQSGVKQLILTHYAGFDSPRAMKKDCKRSGFAGKIIIAMDGMKLRIP